MLVMNSYYIVFIIHYTLLWWLRYYLPSSFNSIRFRTSNWIFFTHQDRRRQWSTLWIGFHYTIWRRWEWDRLERDWLVIYISHATNTMMTMTMESHLHFFNVNCIQPTNGRPSKRKRLLMVICWSFVAFVANKMCAWIVYRKINIY